MQGKHISELMDLPPQASIRSHKILGGAVTIELNGRDVTADCVAYGAGQEGYVELIRRPVQYSGATTEKRFGVVVVKWKTPSNISTEAVAK